MFAELAITDNKPGTLKKVAKNNPWHEQALKLITGSQQRAHLPLRDILYEDMDGLILDCEIDVSGITKGGQFLDTQGYVAHNNDYVVVAFRCTTSIFDWLTNFNTSSSAWELEEDAEQGYSGVCSGLDGLCCQGANYKPRVHTGFYNNFLACLPTIRKHVDQYLVNYERPRQLYVVGHSLGAGIANITATYFLTQYNWKMLPQNLVVVTAGSPRSICKSMKTLIDEKREEYGEKNVRFYRLVKGSDVVASVPPKILGFEHMVEPTLLADDGNIFLRLKQGDAETDPFKLLSLRQEQQSMKNLRGTAPKSLEREANEEDTEEETDEDDDDDDAAEAKYNAMVAKIPKAFRDHMPDFYLKPLFNAKGIVFGTTRKIDEPTAEDEVVDFNTTSKQIQSSESPKPKKKKNRTWVPKAFRKKQVKSQEVGPFF